MMIDEDPLGDPPPPGEGEENGDDLESVGAGDPPPPGEEEGDPPPPGPITK